MSMTETEFKNEVLRRGEKERARIKRNKKIVLSIVPAVVLTAVLFSAALFVNFGNIIASENKSAQIETDAVFADEIRVEGYIEYSTTGSKTTVTVAPTDDGADDKDAAAGLRAAVTVQNGESVSRIIGEKQVGEITDTVNTLINHKSNLMTEDRQTQYIDSVKPDYTIILTDEQGNEKIYYIIKNTFTDDEKVILCDNEQEVKKLIDLIK